MLPGTQSAMDSSGTSRSQITRHSYKVPLMHTVHEFKDVNAELTRYCREVLFASPGAPEITTIQANAGDKEKICASSGSSL